MAEITNWVKKIWKNRTTEFPTRRTLMKEDGSSEIVTVTRNEGTVSEEGDAFDADTMNNLEERIDAGFAEVNGNLPKEWKLISTVTTLSAIGSGKGLTIPDLSSYKELLILTTLSYFETSETYPIINGHINGTGYARPGCYLGSSNWQTCTIYISDAEINVVDYVKNGTAQTSGFFVTFYIR